MTSRVILGIASLCFSLTGLIVANMFTTMMIGEINRKRADGQLVSYFGFTASKMQRIVADYKALYPQGKMHIFSRLAFALAVVGLIGVAGALGFFG